MEAVLTSWKEIAEYMGKGVRSLQRWEREMGFPVHRPCVKQRGVVLAYPSELDAWGKGLTNGQKDQPTGQPTEAIYQLHHDLTLELARLAMSLHISSEHLLDHCRPVQPKVDSDDHAK